jgi:tetratricopeptide (TPR) repeat protein
VEEQLQKLEALSIAPAGATERLNAIKELQRRSDWTGVEAQSKSLADFLARSVPSKFEERRQHTTEALGRLSGIGISIPAQVVAELQALAHPPADQNWGEWVSRLVRVEEALHTAEIGHVTRVRERAMRLAQWSGLPPQRLTEFGRSLEEASRPATEGGLAQSLDGIAALVRDGLPEAAEHRRVVRENATTLVAQAREQGASVSRLEAALDAGSDANPETWPDTVPAIEQGVQEVGEALRGRCSQALEALRSSLASAAEYGVDPSTARQTIDEAIARLETAPVLEIAPIFLEARRSAEEPVVAVIAGLLDEVRPRIAEARQLGRDPSDVFASMNRAREALRLKIYSEAFAASEEALDRVTKLTGDLETARDEFQTVEEMVGRFSKLGFAQEPFEPALARIRSALERTQVAVARDQLKETVLQLGRDALQFFGARWTQLDKLREYARERGFLPASADQAVSEARARLDQGDIGEAAERIAASEVELRVAAAPFVARRVEEMEKGLRDIPDEALTAPVRRLLADADVSLRVKEDLNGAVESLRRAERDFSAVFAAHASALVEGLETEGRVLESMGGASDEIQRQIDEVQQIFNMGDFVKASRASQEIRTRAQQQQLVRGEEAVSHAKLSLVELETMGVDLAKFRTQLDDAQSAAHAGRYLEAYQRATKLEELATRTHAAAQQIIEGLARAQETLGRLRDAGIDPTPFHEALRTARLAFQNLEFDAAQTALETVQLRLTNEEARVETTRLGTETEQLIEDGRRLSLTMEPFTLRLKQLRTEQATAPPDATRTGIRALHEELIAVLRPVLEENLRALDRDLDIARSAGVNVDRILAPLSEARRRITLPLPMGAAALLDNARAEFVSTRGFVEHAERMAMRAREALSQADLLHVDSVPLRNGMEKVEQLLGQRQYARVVETAGPLERELLQATYQHVSKTLAGFQATVSRLRHGGTDTALAENLLNRARAALDEGRPVEALQLASKSEAELERAELQLHLAQGSIEAVGGAISRASQSGLVASTASDEFEAAKAAFQRHAYPDVLEHAITALDALGLAREGQRRAREAVQAAEQQLAEAVQNGAASDEGNARLVEGQQYLASGQYAEAIRAAREATEIGRWAIERLFAAPLGELRRLVETGRSEGLRSEIDPLDSLVSDAEAALRARDWSGVREGIRRAEGSARRIFDTVIEGRWREVESELARIASAPPAEMTRREEVRRQLATLRERRDFSAALDLVRSEMDLAHRRRREEFEGRMSDFKARLWVGERLGVDTTPVMQTFSEARVAIDAGHFDSAELLLARATSALEPAIRAPFERRLKELATEMNFAQEGLHVSVGSVRQKVEQVGELERSGRLLDAARLLLATEEDLNLRKSLHRELMNLHYLIDAAIVRAQERHIDTSVARALLSESVRLRETDYPAALEKAREALRRLQGEGTTPAETPPAQAPVTSTFWPFRRPPTEP